MVKMTFKPEHISAFEKIFEATKAKIRASNGCRHLELLRDVNNPNVFFTYSHWVDTDHLNMYRDSALFAEVWPATKVLFAAKPEAWSTVQKEILV
jgi:quinol monooxygenase YgiN